MGQQVQPPSPNPETIRRKTSEMAASQLEKEFTNLAFRTVLAKIEALDPLRLQGIKNLQETLVELRRLTLSDDEKSLLSKLSDSNLAELHRLREGLQLLQKLHEKGLID